LAERIDEQLTQLFAERRAARFAREHERNGCARQVVVQEPDLSRFAGSLNAFEGNEEAGGYCPVSL
jgi:hypothetical protein